jgi:hypothetical protein
MLVSAVVLGRLRGEGWGRAIRVLAPLGALVVEGWPAMIGTVLVQEASLWLAGRLAAPCQRSAVRRLFLAAYGLRVVIALPTHYYYKRIDGNGSLFPDAYTNDLVGEWLARIARGEGISIFPGHQQVLSSIYPYFLMAIYTVFGYTPLLPKLVNSCLAALSAVLVFEMARRAFRMPVAVLAGLGAAVLPTLVVWSVASLKESLVLFVALLGLWILQFLSTAPNGSRRVADALVSLVAVLTLMLDLRSTTTLILVGLLAVIYVTRSRQRFKARPMRMGLAALAVVVMLGGGLWVARSRTSTRPFSAVVEDVVLQIRHRRAQEAASAGSPLRTQPEVISATGSGLPAAEAASDSAPFTLVGDIFEPLGYALLAPAPWQARSLTEFGASLEMAVWYVLLGTSCLAWVATPRQRLFVACLAVYGIANWLLLAATEGNLGNLLRHRLMLDPILLILGGAGLDWLWVRSGRPFGRRVCLERGDKESGWGHEMGHQA